MQTELASITIWCNEEYKLLDDETFEDDRDYPEKFKCSWEDAEEMCDWFIDSLEPFFNLLLL